MLKKLQMLLSVYRERRKLAEFDVSKFLTEQERFFEQVGLNLEDAVQTTKSYFTTSARIDSSMHYEVVAALVIQKSIRQILEIGTQTGRFTKFIAELAEDVIVTTIDLPVGNVRFDNAIHPNVEAVNVSERLSSSHKLRNENLAGLRNVTFREMNSVQLLNHHETYDLVFVDGDHTFPIVAIDAMNALRLVNETGWILFDDLRPHDGARSEFGGAETTVLLEVLEAAGIIEVFRFHKRLEANRLYDPSNRKMIALARRRRS
jgi:predicted O-methyltransferase YrrM